MLLAAGKSLPVIHAGIQAGPSRARHGRRSVRAEVAGVDGGESRLLILRKVDEELRKGNEREALALVRGLLGAEGGLRCFGSARQVPQRLYTLEELKLNGIDTSSLLLPVDSTLRSIERIFQIVVLLGGLVVWSFLELSNTKVLLFSIGLFFLWAFDSIGFGGGVWNLLLDTLGHSLNKKYHNRVIQHEAGHFLVAYLLGVLPKAYTLSSLEALRLEGSFNVQAGTAFVDFEFLYEMLNTFSCIALAGVITEYLLYGYSEGGIDDINKLDGLLKSLGFTQKKADSQVRWAVLNTASILRRHEGVRMLLAKAMASGNSIGSCVDLIERAVGLDV